MKRSIALSVFDKIKEFPDDLDHAIFLLKEKAEGEWAYLGYRYEFECDYFRYDNSVKCYIFISGNNAIVVSDKIFWYMEVC